MQLAAVAFGAQLASQLSLNVLHNYALHIPSLAFRRTLAAGLLITYLLSFGGQLAVAIGHGYWSLAAASFLGRAVAEALALTWIRSDGCHSWLELRVVQVMTWIPTGALYAPFALGLGAS